MPTSEIVCIGKDAGYDSLFIDQLCAAGIMSGITPFVQVPHQFGNGFVQHVPNSGAIGVIFPHLVSGKHSLPANTRFRQTLASGKHSLTAGLPHFAHELTSLTNAMGLLDASGSTVILMIEIAEAIANVDAIAVVQGVDVLLIGSNDLSLDLRIQGQWDSPIFKESLEKVANACKNSGILLGFAGLLGARYILGNLDIGLVTEATKANLEVLKTLE
ncbi:Pyruvate/Phosphoenolpyruvate kinase [Rhexocercosporidium sp. MPI-PUGE-AT-0058]|nr:Pyruvate/Phosphoenolpyruvate kinase [Rhexocercosporidium sp. MPI-PUGE-AT-0058]